jgi:DinB family protein
MDREAELRDHLVRLLAWQDAHGTFEAAVGGVPPSHRERVPQGVPYSPWQLLEHLRITQHDILDFCRNPNYTELHWPDDYWPRNAAPPSDSAWDDSVRGFLEDRAALQALATDRSVDLLATIPHGGGQTYLREILLAADHTSYHVGQLILVRRLLGIWS